MIPCPDCEGEKTTKEVQGVRLVSRDAPDSGAGSAIELPCKRCRGRGEVPDIAIEDWTKAMGIVDAWMAKILKYEYTAPDTDELIEAVAIALVEERERGRKTERETCSKIAENEYERSGVVAAKRVAITIRSQTDNDHNCGEMGCDPSGHVIAKLSL